MFGGRTNGLHNFSPSGEQSFPPSFQNNVIYVINPVNWQVWSRPWSQTDVPPSAIPVFKLGIYPQTDQPCAVAEA